VVTESEEVILASITGRIFSSSGVWKLFARAEYVAMCVHGTKWESELRLRRALVPVQPARRFLKSSGGRPAHDRKVLFQLLVDGYGIW
jgi:hypothetical protein